MTFRVGWFSTGRDRAARDLLRMAMENMERGTIPDSRICYVFSNREWRESQISDSFFRLIEDLRIPLICCSYRKFFPQLRKKALIEQKKGNLLLINRWRLLYDRKIMRLTREHPVDVIVLAGYMLILGGKFCRNYPVINLHPALPGGPRGTWQEVIWQLIEEEADRSGVMMHLVTSLLDSGSPLTYSSFSLKGEKFTSLWDQMKKKIKKKGLKQIQKEEGEGEPLFKAIRREGVKREFPLVVMTLQAVAEGKIRIEKGAVLIGKKRDQPLCLDGQFSVL